MKDLVFGIHSVTSWLKQHPAQVETLLVREAANSKRLQAIIQLARDTGCPLETVSLETLDEMVNAPHQGVILRVQHQSDRSEKDLEDMLSARLDASDQGLLLVILDGVTDPRNLGACLRSAAAACADAVIVPRRGSADLTPVARKAASGGADLVPLYRVTNLGRTMDYLKALGIWITGTDPNSEKDISSVDFRGHCALVLGSEGSGMREGVRRRCDFLVSIPMPRTDFSLNVSVAAGITLFEAVRQRALDLVDLGSE